MQTIGAAETPAALTNAHYKAVVTSKPTIRTAGVEPPLQWHKGGWASRPYRAYLAASAVRDCSNGNQQGKI